MNILKLAREAFTPLTYRECTVDELQAFANAVIASRDAELIEGVGEPVLLLDAQTQTLHWTKPTKIDVPMTVEIPKMPLYTREQLAGAVAKAYQQGKDDAETKLSGGYHAMASQDRKRITTLESTLRVALEALNTVEWYGPGSCWIVDADAIEEAFSKCKEVLHD